ncbi:MULTISPECIES: cyclic nucleotide-binding domain-containing protein [unclassified Janthinobacterium]|uniref:cyclic nucleotide-binding domain-containing protein n=1 Tax=unclassified Janthinobacterium TaxID=2610881 RepID=UPI0003474947|nr:MULTISPECIES: cyclic nucleotide-binding domain-containing protein [unclassified Janthinobacterium]MEC5163990.1 CRP-like cAMP-binding protein/Fe-S-cluster-containing hydrogenase component 2/thioredoxin reductase [Janthinobacterium sp. CG_S6]
MIDSGNTPQAQDGAAPIDGACFDIVIVGSGPAGLSAAARAKALGTRHVLLEADAQHASDTIFKYQKGKHVMAEPGILPLRSDMSFTAGKREMLLDTWNRELGKLDVNIAYGKRVSSIARDGQSGIFTLGCEDGSQYLSRAVILGIGLQGNIRKTGTPGQDHPRVQYTLADPDEFSGETIIVIGAGDAGIENALGLANQNTVYMVNRGEEFLYCKDGNRTLITNAEKTGKITICYSATTLRIEESGEAIPLNFVYSGKGGETVIPCHRVIARLGATPPRKLIESFGIEFPNANPTSVPVLSESYESNVPGLYIVGALGGYPLIKQAMNQGYEVVHTIVGQPVEPVDEPLLRNKFKPWKPDVAVSGVIDLIMETVPLFKGMSKLQLREFMLDSNLQTPRAGSVVFKKLDYTNTFYSILDGDVDVEISNEDGSLKVIKLTKGRYFGEMGLISGRRRTATIRAGKGCVLLETPRRSMLKLIAAVDDVRRQMDAVFVRYAITNFIGPMLSAEAINALVEASVDIRRYQANDVLCREGDAADGLYLIRRGSVTVSKTAADGRERILSYVSAGNYVGEMALVNDAPRSATITATVFTEALVLNGAVFKQQLDANPLLRKSIEAKMLTRTRTNVALERSTGRESDLMRFLLGQGVGEASDVLLIDESLCIQCNNCETACAETHDGTSRLKREAGPTFANIHLPTACRHCEHPHCMKECPPDAISRSEAGEVFISDACIGCGNCERNCPYGVIQMASEKPPKKGGGLPWLLFGLGKAPGQRQADYDANAPKKAVKCDLCSGLKGGAACVRACPTGAAIRISPEDFFKSNGVR